MDFVLIDTDVFIDLLRQQEPAAYEIARAEQLAPVAASIITRMELVTGCTSKEMLQRTAKLLRNVRWIDLDADISRVADGLVTTYHLSHGLRIPDALIAATAIVYDSPLLSKNQRDFRFLTQLALLPYPSQ